MVPGGGDRDRRGRDGGAAMTAHTATRQVRSTRWVRVRVRVRVTLLAVAA
jgi:hypothetical protein